MKPPAASPGQSPRQKTPRRFPITNCNYQAVSLDEFKPSCADAPRSGFDLISRDYFNGEARRSFVTEAVVFVAMAATTVPALIDCARALAMFFRAFGM